MADTTNALRFLSAKKRPDPPAVCVAFGDEPFLKRLVIAEWREAILDDEDSEFSLTTLQGKAAELRDVLDELATATLFGGSRRMVLVEEADDFVSRHRGALENYTASPAAGGVLVLEVRAWSKSTRLYKAVAKTGLQIECAAPPPAKLLTWLGGWAKERHAAELDPAAAELLIEIIGPELGLLDQELAKLAVAVGPDETIRAETVHQMVGGWRAKTTWDMIDAAVSGDAHEAFLQLDRLLTAGEHPLGLLGPIGYTLRRFAAAARLVQQAQEQGRRLNLRDALKQAGVKPFAVHKAEKQLRQLGRPRGLQLNGWLLAADLDLKGRSNLPPRTILERLIVRMSSTMAPQVPARARA